MEDLKMRDQKGKLEEMEINERKRGSMCSVQEGLLRRADTSKPPFFKGT